MNIWTDTQPQPRSWSDGSTRYVVHRPDGSHYGYHRMDGPAIITPHSNEWWYHDMHYTFDNWVEISKCSPEQAVMLKLQYG